MCMVLCTQYYYNNNYMSCTCVGIIVCWYSLFTFIHNVHIHFLAVTNMTCILYFRLTLKKGTSGMYKNKEAEQIMFMFYHKFIIFHCYFYSFQKNWWRCKWPTIKNDTGIDWSKHTLFQTYKNRHGKYVTTLLSWNCN